MADKTNARVRGAGRRKAAGGGNAAASRGEKKPGGAAKPAGRPAARRRGKPTAEPRPGRRPWLIVLAALALAAGGGATIAYLEERRANAAMRRELAAQVEALQQRTAALAEKNGLLEARQRAGDEALERLSGQLGDLYRQRQDAPDQRLMEARRLLYAVSMQLALGQDIDEALATLPVAAARLAAIPDPALAPVRAALRIDIERLRALPRQDLEGVARRLGELARQAEQFPLGLDRTRAAAPAAAVAAPPEEWWRRLGHAVKQELKSLVVISRADNNAAALLPPERYFLYQNLKLQLEAARLALLFRDGDQFRAAVAGCADWLRDYFDGGDQRVRAAQAELAQAAQLEFLKTPPAIDGALQALDAYLAGEGAP